jgi:hypothetical protein
VRVVAPVVTGSGTLSANRGFDYGGNPKSAYGRIRIDCQDNLSYRTLRVTGFSSRGTRMVVFSTNAPRLDIIEVAGQAIPEGTNNAVQFVLPAEASTNQTVTVQARNFTNDVPIRVVITPENGPSSSFDAVILQASGNPPSATVPVIIPAGSVCQINAWTR